MTSRLMTSRLLTLREFMAVAPAALEAFQSATREQTKLNVGTWASSRTETDWWREVAAYAMYIDLDEESRR